jgi:DNA polymerase-1
VAANIASYTGAGVEADDYIAFATNSAARRGWEVVIASADKDFMQLVGPGVGLLNPNDKSETIWTAEQVRVKTGVRPEQIVDWLSLLGDSVDNIPGVPGVGTKTATKLLDQFGSVAAMYARLLEVQPERIQQALRGAEADVRRNQSLVRLKPEVGQVFAAEGLAVKPADMGQLASLFREWGFRSLLAEVLAGTERQPELI